MPSAAGRSSDDAATRACEALAGAQGGKATVLSQRDLLAAVNQNESFRAALREDPRLQGLLKPRTFGALFAEIEGYSRAPKGNIDMEGLAAFLDAHILDSFDAETGEGKGELGEADNDNISGNTSISGKSSTSKEVVSKASKQESKTPCCNPNHNHSATSHHNEKAQVKSNITAEGSIPAKSSLPAKSGVKAKSNGAASTTSAKSLRSQVSADKLAQDRNTLPSQTPSIMKNEISQKESAAADVEARSPNRTVVDHGQQTTPIRGSREYATDISMYGSKTSPSRRVASNDFVDSASVRAAEKERIMSLARTESEARLLQQVDAGRSMREGLTKDDMAYIDHIEKEQRERSAAARLFMESYEGAAPDCLRYVDWAHREGHLEQGSASHNFSGALCSCSHCGHHTASSPAFVQTSSSSSKAAKTSSAQNPGPSVVASRNARGGRQLERLGEPEAGSHVCLVNPHTCGRHEHQHQHCYACKCQRDSRLSSKMPTTAGSKQAHSVGSVMVADAAGPGATAAAATATAALSFDAAGGSGARASVHDSRAAGTVAEIAQMCRTNACQWLDQVLTEGTHATAQQHLRLGRMHVQVLAQCVGDLLRELEVAKGAAARAREESSNLKKKNSAAEGQRRAELDALRASNQHIKAETLQILHQLRTAVRRQP